jgi:hypothetical protein
MFGLLVVPIAGFTGVAVDYNRTSNARAVVSAAADAAVLAATKLEGVDRATREQVANSTFAANIQGVTGLSVTSRQLSAVTDNQWRFEVSATLPPALMTLVGQGPIALGARSEAVISTATTARAMEYVIAHDITNSMFFDPAQMQQAVDAMKGFVDRAMQASGTIGTVMPFSDRVRLPQRANAWANGSRPPHWQGCLAPREQVVAGRINTLTDDPHTALAFAYHTDTTRTNPNHPGASYTFGCFGAEVTVAEHRAEPLKDALGSMGSGGTGRYDEAMAWAWRMLSPRWRNQWNRGNYPADYGAIDKLAILVSDGRNEAGRYEALPASGNPHVYGWNMGTRESFENMEHVCTAMKTAGIRIVVVQLDGNSHATPHMRACASAPSDHHFVTNLNQFRTAFQSIGGATTRTVRLVK